MSAAPTSSSKKKAKAFGIPYGATFKSLARGKMHGSSCSYSKLKSLGYAVIALLITTSQAETSSFLENATVSDEFVDPGWSGDHNSVIESGFKNYIHFKSKDPKEDGSHD